VAPKAPVPQTRDSFSRVILYASFSDEAENWSPFGQQYFQNHLNTVQKIILTLIILSFYPLVFIYQLEA
jgi:hypothetical protein